VQIRAIALTVGIAMLGIAWAADAPASPEAVIPRLKCRSFPTDPGAEVDTRDAGTDLGRWVTALEDQGWEVHNVDWTVGQKPTGFPQGYTHVCMIPVAR
jgi:hypothetical protein